MRHTFRTLLGITLVTLVLAVPVGLAFHKQEQQRNFRVVRDGVLYRSGQMTRAGLERALHDYGIRTVVSLRDREIPGEAPPDQAEEEFCKKMEVRHVRITPRNWEGPDLVPPVEVGVQQFLAVMRDPGNYPVLVHCFAGIHRTGAYTAIYRMELEGWASERALTEMKACGYDNLENELDILGYLRTYHLRHPEPGSSPYPGLPCACPPGERERP